MRRKIEAPAWWKSICIVLAVAMLVVAACVVQPSRAFAEGTQSGQSVFEIKSNVSNRIEGGQAS